MSAMDFEKLEEQSELPQAAITDPVALHVASPNVIGAAAAATAATAATAAGAASASAESEKDVWPALLRRESASSTRGRRARRQTATERNAQMCSPSPSPTRASREQLRHLSPRVNGHVAIALGNLPLPHRALPRKRRLIFT